MYHCNSCGERFEKPMIRLPQFDDPGETICPICGDDYIDAMVTCEMCHEAWAMAGEACMDCKMEILKAMHKAYDSISFNTGAKRIDVLAAMQDWVERYAE